MEDVIEASPPPAKGRKRSAAGTAKSAVNPKQHQPEPPVVPSARLPGTPSEAAPGDVAGQSTAPAPEAGPKRRRASAPTDATPRAARAKRKLKPSDFPATRDDPFGLIRYREAMSPRAQPAAPAEEVVVEPGPLPEFPDALWALPLYLAPPVSRASPLQVQSERTGPGSARHRHAELEAMPETLECMNLVLDLMFEPEPVLAADSVPIDAGRMVQLNKLADLADAEMDAPLVERWTEEEVVYLHWRLLRSITSLADPRAGMLEKISVYRWVFNDDPVADEQPFSFVQCLKVVGCSPLTNVNGLGYVGNVDARELRDLLVPRVARWMAGAFDAYPLDLREDIALNPDYYMRKLETDPQWIAKKLRERERRTAAGQASLFD